MNSNECCDCCGEALTGVEQLNADKRRALASIRNANLAFEALDYEAAKRHIKEAQRQLTEHQP